MARAQKTETPVAAREALDQRNESDNTEDRLEEQAKEQEAQQKEELSSKAAGDNFPAEENAVKSRYGKQQNGPVNGFIDQNSRRNATDALEGHFVSIDLNDKGVKDAYKSAGLPEDFDGDYGVYMTVGEVGDDGYPETAVVRLRGDTAINVTVPYSAIRTTGAGRR